VQLHRVTFEADGINSYELVPLPGQSLPAFTAGAHVDLCLPNALIRSYSLLNDPRERARYTIAVAKDVNSRGGSRYVHDSLRVGALLTISPPRNNFPLQEEAAHSVFIGGGIGITPLLSMIARLQALGRSWELHYASRTRRRAAFLDRLRELAGPGGEARLHLVFDGEAGASPLDIAAIVAAAPADAHLYCCGPLPMLAAFEQATANLPPAQRHVEYFAPREAAATEGGFELILQRSGRSLHVAPGQSMLAALQEAGVDVAFACSEGLCGTCETRVIAGVPDHRDQFLTDAERAANASVMICCSGSKTPSLVLDL